MAAARLEIRIWTDGATELPTDLPEAFEPHVSHVQNMLSRGFTSGAIVDERFRGWWDIKDD